MKKLYNLLIPVASIALSSCVFGGKTTSFNTDALTHASISAYNIIEMANDDDFTRKNHKMGALDVYFADDLEGVPLLSLSEYAKLLSFSFYDGYTYDISSQGKEASLTVVNDKEEAVYQVFVNYTYATMTYVGSLSNAANNYIDLDQASLMLRTKIESDWEWVNSYYSVDSFETMRIPTHLFGSDYFLPLSLWEISLGVQAGIHHFYSGEAIYRYDGPEQLGKTFEKEDGESSSAVSYWENYFEEKKAMPAGIATASGDAFNFAMTNSYGLKERKMGKQSVEQYFSKYEEGLYATDPDTHVQSVLSSLNSLDDDHTGLTSLAYWWGESADKLSSRRGQRSIARSQTMTALQQRRKAALNVDTNTMGAVNYSSDGPLAMISFDAFVYSLNAFDQGKIRDDLASEDTYFYLIETLQAIKARGNVKNVVLDLSVNGGGVVGTMLSILPLLSADNQATAFMLYGKMGNAINIYVQSDSTGNNVYDADDVFGDDFRVSILVGDASFSCGNALPFFAKKQGLATIIGQRSGGGECAVEEATLPSGHTFLYSSSTHFGWCNGDFEGDEDGVAPDIELSYDQFYDLDAIQQKLK